MASLAAAAKRTASSAGHRVPGSGGRMEASTACWTRPASRALVMRASHSSRSAVVRWSSDSWRALAMARPSSSSITVREAVTTARSSRRR